MTIEHISRFDKAAKNYQTDRYSGRGQCMDAVLRFLDLQLEDIVLDIGCASGAQLIAITNYCKYGYGIDPSREMIKRAQQDAKNIANIEFYIGTTDCLPSASITQTVNKVYSNYALHHLNDEEKYQAIKKVAMILPQNGIFILGDLMFSEEPENHRNLFDIVGFGPGCDTPAYIVEIEHMFERVGFSVSKQILTPLTGIIIGNKLHNNGFHDDS